MISRYAVWLNDAGLAEIDSEIVLTDIAYAPSNPAFQSERIAASDGQFIGADRYIASNKVTVYFMVRQYNTQMRQEIVQNIIAWAAKGGWLKTSDRPGQRMYVQVSKYPVVSSAQKWSDNLTVEFMAYDYPFWTDETPKRVTLDSGDEEEVFVPGFRETYVEATIVPSETLENFTIECGDTYIEIDDISIPADQPITISYTADHHILEIKSDGVSLLDKRTPESSDDLVIGPGKGTVCFDCETEAECTLFIRGVYL